MELIYLWVEDYKNIKQQGFNFSPRFECEFFPEYDDDRNLKDTCKLDIKPKKHLENFFGDNINITAIVGENGSGKSSIIELLKNDYDYFHLGTLFFIYFDKKNNQLIFSGLEILPINIENSVSFPLKIDAVFSTKITLLEKTKTIFFTHLFHNDYDLKLPSIDLHHTQVINLSSIYELADANVMETEPSTSDTMRTSSFSKIYRAYSTKQIQKAVLAIKNDNFKLPFTAPLYLKIKQIRTERILEKIIDNSSNDTVKSICEKLLTLYKANVASWEKTGKSKDLDDLGVKMILAFILEETTNTSDESMVEPCLKEIEKLTDEENIQEYVTRIYKKFNENDFTFFIEKDNEKLNAHFPQTKTYFEKTKYFLELYNKIKSFHVQGSPISHSLDEIVLDIKENDFEFLEIYLELMSYAERFLEFSWPNLSSGEENFLYQFSRFFYLKNYSKDIYDKLESIENLVILFDEGEITLHPQWQKQYIHYCIDFFQNNFSDYKCHLIFTTHSPFLLSDIPKENVIFLEKDKDGNCKNATKEITIDTFGANIHTLLSHGFFMKDGLMGEFAKSKIEEIKKFYDLIQKLKHKIENNSKTRKLAKKSFERRIKKFKEVHSIIGEPFLKTIIGNYLDELEQIFDPDTYKQNQKEKLLSQFTKEELQKHLDSLND